MVETKICAYPKCGKTFTKRPKESASIYETRRYCCNEHSRKHKREIKEERIARIHRLAAAGVPKNELAAMEGIKRAQIGELLRGYRTQTDEAPALRLAARKVMEAPPNWATYHDLPECELELMRKMRATGRVY